MILIDTTLWIDHLAHPDERIRELLARRIVLIHPFVIGEIAVGRLRNRDSVLDGLHSLREAVVAEPDEVLSFIVRHQLEGTGIGYVDVHLLASVRLTPGLKLWTRDKPLKSIAERLGVAADIRAH